MVPKSSPKIIHAMLPHDLVRAASPNDTCLYFLHNYCESRFQKHHISKFCLHDTSRLQHPRGSAFLLYSVYGKLSIPIILPTTNTQNFRIKLGLNTLAGPALAQPDSPPGPSGPGIYYGCIFPHMYTILNSEQASQSNRLVDCPLLFPTPFLLALTYSDLPIPYSGARF